ncbi:MAG: substrate-binding domain-containing protein [Bauldia sp.]|nr:substrate-binding domain-containing protein [Bauldia sp.]
MTNRDRSMAGMRSGRGRSGAPRGVTIRDLAAELGLSITTISRALGGYSDVGDQTRRRVTEAAERMGYRPNRNAQRLVTQRTFNIAWVQPDDELKFLDPHFVEVMSGVLRGARASNYDIVLTSHTPERELEVYDRYVKDRSVDGFILDLPRKDDPRIEYLVEAGMPFVVHGRASQPDRYGWVDIDNYGAFYRLARMLVANGHRGIAFINGSEQFHYARHRRQGVADAIADAGLPGETLSVYNTQHPLRPAGFDFTVQAMTNPAITAIIYSSILMAIEGLRAADAHPRSGLALATMDDELHYLDVDRVSDRLTFVRSSLSEGGLALIAELSRQCDDREEPRGTLVPVTFHVHPSLDRASLDAPLPAHRTGFIG